MDQNGQKIASLCELIISCNISFLAVQLMPFSSNNIFQIPNGRDGLWKSDNATGLRLKVADRKEDILECLWPSVYI